ncbi:MAG: carboxypeptidase-like regulatory domain-containing protein [Balneolaceae bacterium]
MREIGIAFLFIVFLQPVFEGEIFAQTAIEGRVVNAESGEPLSGAHVFLSGTKTGTITNDAGRYRLSRMQPGFHRLVISMIGYGRYTLDIRIAPGQSLTENVEMEPVVYEMDEIYAGNLDERWERHLERFIQLFIGESERADSVKILNPEVLRFDTKWWGRFTAEALAPLEIENRALGYNIIYYLDEFYHTGTTTRWDGEPLFSEMTPSDSTQEEYWSRNREEAFSGSLRHFLITLVEDRADDEGFTIYNQRRGIHGISVHDKRRIRSGSLIRETDEEHLYHMRFSGRLEIIYSNGEEDPRYVRWARHLNRGPSTVQTSYLELNERPITIDPDGEIEEVYGATRFGYFAFLRLADKTPREYRAMNSE